MRLFYIKKTQQHVDQFIWQKILLLIIVLLIGLGLRLIALSDIFIWMDETDNFDEQIYHHMSTSLRRYIAAEAQELTLGPVWPLIIALTCKIFGGVVKVGRMPSVLFGTAAILAIFILVYHFIRPKEGKGLFAPALFAAILTTVSIVHMEFSQRIIPYGAVPFFTMLIIITHLKIVDVIEKNILEIKHLIIWCVLYTLVSGFSVYLHMSFTIVLAGSFLLLVGKTTKILKLDYEKKVVVFGIFTLTFLALFLATIGNAIHAKSGYRYYLAPYYHSLSFDAIPFLVTRVYDLLTYNLNLFYNGDLYWPRRFNPILLPLIVVCIIGWYYSFSGKFKRLATHLSIWGLISILITAVLSLIKKYPFGGVRQTLFMSPFIFTFTALGFYTLMRSRPGKVIAVVLTGTYFILWGINLPHFYSQRITPYTKQDLVKVWEENGKLVFYGDGSCSKTMRYTLREFPDIKFDDLDLSHGMPKPPFFLISPHWPMEDSVYFPNLKKIVEKLGYRKKLIMVRDATYPVHPAYFQSLYYPANGLWIYKITDINN